ncbi:MAG: hypothetical protein H0T46_08415 [Deltaproteobacteria bacterium]|nr:hypothetical protein [Deltaproteobacteria bacterium]
MDRLLWKHTVNGPGKIQWPFPPPGFHELVGLEAGPPILLLAERPWYRHWRIRPTLLHVEPDALDSHAIRYDRADVVLVAGTTTAGGLQEAARWCERIASDIRDRRASRVAPLVGETWDLPDVPFAVLLDDGVPGGSPRPTQLDGYPVYPLSAAGLQQALGDAWATLRRQITERADELLRAGAAHHFRRAFVDDAIARDLHQRILEQPLADAPRHALGAHLHDRVDPRGEFIALQLRYAAFERRGTSDPEMPQILTRARVLYAEHRARWTEHLDAWCSKQRFSRGFVETVTLSPSDWLFGHGEITARAPVLGLRLTAADRFAEAVAHPSFESMLALMVGGIPIGDAGAVALARSPYVRQLRWLNVIRCGIGPAGLAALASSTQLINLRWIGTAENDAPPPPYEALLPVVGV